MKKTLVLLGLALAVTLGFCGCGPSEEEVYEILARVEQKQKKIKEANLSMDQGFQEKWDLLERQFTSANRAFSKGDYSATAKFLQDAEAAADWIMSRGPLRYEADEKYSELQSRKRYSNSNEINAPKYASTIYAEAEEYEQQGQEAYEMIEFEEATRLYVLATNKYKKAASTASTFHAALYKANTAKEKADRENASRYAAAITLKALDDVLGAAKANAQGRYDEALQLLGSAENKFENAAVTASQFTAAQQKANAAKEKADKEKASQFASTIYQPALSPFQQAIKANAQGRYDEALQLLESAENKFENAAVTASQFTTAQQKANGAKEKADKEKASQFASTIYQPALSPFQQAIKANAQGRYDEALQLLESAENKFENAAVTASQFTTARRKTYAAEKKADEEGVVPSYASTLYQEAVAKIQPAIDANAQGKYDEALQLLESAVETFEKAEKEACKKSLSNLVKSFVKIEELNYYIGKYEVTQAQWKAVMGNNPADFKGADRPVECVSWHKAMQFCEKLNYLELAPAGYEFSLPTVVQWKYAARGGNKNKGYEYSGSNDIEEVAWYGKNSGGQTHPVGEKKPNELGLYDMSGNVWEWCLDAFGSDRIGCGGGWSSDAEFCHVARRLHFSDPGKRYYAGGFRLVLVPVQ